MKNLYVSTEKGIKVEKKMIHKLVSEISKKEEFQTYSLEINFVTEKTIINLNAKYLNHNYPTDIITFNYSNNFRILEGEIYICMKVALENSLKYEVNLDNELLRLVRLIQKELNPRLVIHGILHMTGYDDKKAQDRKKMKIKEDELVSAFEIEFKNLIIGYDSENS